MNSVFLCYRRCVLHGLLATLTFLFSGSLTAQNLNNAGFEAPISTGSVTTNWVVSYVYGGADDFCLRDRTRYANHSGSFGGHFRPITEGSMHAYFKQTVSGLATNVNYVVSGWMKTTWASGGADEGKFNVWIESVGGLGNLNTAYCITETWTKYSVTNTARVNGTIEIRLHYDKPQPTLITDNKTITRASGCWDDISIAQQ